MKEFNKRLKDLRIEKNISQVELARQTGISRAAIGFWEEGKRTPNAQAIIILAKFFGVTTDYLLGVEN